MKPKKAVEMSMNVIVVAALVLIVLIVLTFLMTGKLGWFTKQINNCPLEDAKVIGTNTDQDCLAQSGIPSGRYKDATEEKTCCKKLT